MRTSIAGATFLLLGAGAAAVGAATNGNNLALTGSDTLFKVTNDVIGVCDGALHGAFNAAGNLKPGGVSLGISYIGGGSGVGANAMALGMQELAPMSRNLKNYEYCSYGGANPAYPGLASEGTTNALLVGVDGVSIVSNTASSCTTNVAKTGSFTYTKKSDGTQATYNVTNSLDVLRLVYGGTDAAGFFAPVYNEEAVAGTFPASNPKHITNDYGCNGNIRKALLANWSALFGAACGAGKCDGSTAANNSVQPLGVSHAFRRSDLSGTTDAFLSLVGFAGRKIGNNPATTPAPFSYVINAFCNSPDANADATAPKTSTNGTSCAADTDCPQSWGSRCVASICTGTKAGASDAYAADQANQITNTGTDLPNGPAGSPIAIPCLLAGTTANGLASSGSNPVLLANPNNINADCMPALATSDPATYFGDAHKFDSVCQQVGTQTTGFGTCHPGSLATTSDYTDNDPIRTGCDSDPNTGLDTDVVCELDGTLGVVLPVLLPDVAGVTNTDALPANDCDAGNTCVLSKIGDPSLPCPKGGPKKLGACYFPAFTGKDLSPPQSLPPSLQCNALSSNKCFSDKAGDGRVFNMTMKKPQGSQPGQAVLDSNNNLMLGSFFRIHARKPSSYASTAANGATACNISTVTSVSDTNLIGCMAAADPCALGFAGREADQVFSGSALNGLNQANTVNGLAPRPDTNISSLLDGVIGADSKKCTVAGAANCPIVGGVQYVCNTQFSLCYPPTDVTYPLSRRLYVASLVGFGALQGGENQLALCYGDNNLVTSIMQADNFVPMPGAGIQCLDYPQENSGLATGVYLANCPSSSIGGANIDACGNGSAPTISHPAH
jgi:ABC-type phosphate transport system substrate-binding protein